MTKPTPLSLGFSLIELMVVIALIGLLTSFALPSYQHYLQKARFTEILIATAPFKTAVTLALQQGIAQNELNNEAHGIPKALKATTNLSSLLVENGIITATASERLNKSTYILKPNTDGSQWSVGGSCLKNNWCEA